MENLKLNNGMSVVYAGQTKSYSVALSVNVGHVNEPKLGIANLFERTLLIQSTGILPIFGGTMTAYTAGGNNLETVLSKVCKIFNQTVINEEYISRAKEEICKQTRDIAPMTMRRMKLAYKHVAFGADLVKTTEEYLSALNSYSVDDVREFANNYYTASNTVLVISGPKVPSETLVALAEQYFGEVPSGTPTTCPQQMKKNLYTGGFEHLTVDDNCSRLMFGWDMKHLTIDDSPTTNVMMSMFLRRMERAYADAGMTDVQVDFKIAGYYGLRTIRAYVMSQTYSAKELTDIFTNAVNRICDTLASDYRMERSRNAAMAEKLDKYERSDNRALETAWQIVGRGNMYNVDNRINSIWETSSDDVRDLATKVFRGSRLTYIVTTAKGNNNFYSYRDVMTQIGLSHLLKESDA